jgi:hypothetical protein
MEVVVDLQKNLSENLSESIKLHYGGGDYPVSIYFSLFDFLLKLLFSAY